MAGPEKELVDIGTVLLRIEIRHVVVGEGRHALLYLHGVGVRASVPVDVDDSDPEGFLRAESYHCHEDAFSGLSQGAIDLRVLKPLELGGWRKGGWREGKHWRG